VSFSSERKATVFKTQVESALNKLKSISQSSGLTVWLQALRLEHIQLKLAELGATEISDLQFLSPEDIDDFPLKPLEKKKFLAAVAKLCQDNTIALLPTQPSFTLILISSDSEEFHAVSESIDFQQHHEHYVVKRIQNKQLPITFKLVGLTKIVNSALEKAFHATLQHLKNLGRTPEEVKIRRGYHGTRPVNMESIAKSGLLKVGNPQNPSKATDSGWFGDPKEGIYVSRYVEYTLQYSNFSGQRVKTVMLKAIPGKTVHVTKVTPGMPPTEGYDSHSSPNFLEWYLFQESQCCPTYILELEAIENARISANDGINAGNFSATETPIVVPIPVAIEQHMPLVNQQKTLKAKALFDYIATADTELSFKEGDVLIVTEQDASGWWYATLIGQSGYVASTFMQVLQEAKDQKVEDQQNITPQQVQQPECKAAALYDYTAMNDTELSFTTGTILTVIEKDPSGWWYATLNGQSGFVPGTYFECL